MSNIVKEVGVKLTVDGASHAEGFDKAEKHHESFIRSGRGVERQLDMVVKGLLDAKSPAEAFSQSMEHIGRTLEIGLTGGVVLGGLAVIVDKLGEAYDRSVEFDEALEHIGQGTFSKSITSASGFNQELKKSQELLDQIYEDASKNDLGSMVKRGWDSLLDSIESGKTPGEAYSERQIEAGKKLEANIEEFSRKLAGETIVPQSDIMDKELQGNRELANYMKIQLDYRQRIKELDSEHRTPEADLLRLQMGIATDSYKKQVAFQNNQQWDAIDIARSELAVREGAGQNGGLSQILAGIAADKQQRIMEQYNFAGDAQSKGQAELAMINLREGLTISPEQMVNFKSDSLAAIGGGGNIGPSAGYSKEMLEVLQSIDKNIETMNQSRISTQQTNEQIMRN